MNSHSVETLSLNRYLLIIYSDRRALSKGTYNRNRKSASKEKSTALLIKICFGFTCS